MAIIYLARHGETTWNVEGRYQGRRESALSDLGRSQAQALAAAFTAERNPTDPVPTRIITSPLGRCRLTAEPTASALGLPLEIDDRLIEIGHGTWEGLLRDEIAEQFPETYATWRTRPAEVAFDGGETLADVAKRWQQFADELARQTQTTLIVSHDAVVRIALLAITQKPLADFWRMRVENGAFAVFESDGGSLALREDLRTAHLRTLRASITGQAL